MSVDVVLTFFAYSRFMQDDWDRLEKPYGSIFLSIPTVLDSSLAPEGHHILHIFTTSGIDDWKVEFSLNKITFYYLLKKDYILLQIIIFERWLVLL